NVLSKTLPWQEIYLPIYADAELSRSYQTLEVEGRRFIRLNALQESGELYGLEVAGAIIKSKGPVRIVGGNAVSLSSGQLSLFRFALQICLHIENGTLLLLDEPETHLHPNFITELVDLLDSILEQTGSLAIVATHSAYFVREVPREQVLVIKEGEERVV